MTYEITKDDFLSIVDKPHCLGTEKLKGLAKDGHENCSFCKGNYFVDGECNYGGKHALEEDLAIINKNFRDFDILVKHQTKLTDSKSKAEFEQNKVRLLSSFDLLKKKCKSDGEEFFGGSCVGIDMNHKSVFQERIKSTFRRLARELEYYANKVSKTTWEELQKFQEKLEKIEKMQSEALQLTQEWKEAKDRGDEAEATRILALLTKKNGEIANLQNELKKDPMYSLFNQEKGQELSDIVKNIFHGRESFFQWNEKIDDSNNKNQEKFLGFIPKKWKSTFLWIGFGVIVLLAGFLFYRIIRKFFK